MPASATNWHTKKKGARLSIAGDREEIHAVNTSTAPKVKHSNARRLHAGKYAQQKQPRVPRTGNIDEKNMPADSIPRTPAKRLLAKAK